MRRVLLPQGQPLLYTGLLRPGPHIALITTSCYLHLLFISGFTLPLHWFTSILFTSGYWSCYLNILWPEALSFKVFRHTHTHTPPAAGIKVSFCINLCFCCIIHNHKPLFDLHICATNFLDSNHKTNDALFQICRFRFAFCPSGHTITHKQRYRQYESRMHEHTSSFPPAQCLPIIVPFAFWSQHAIWCRWQKVSSDRCEFSNSDADVTSVISQDHSCTIAVLDFTALDDQIRVTN